MTELTLNIDGPHSDEYTRQVAYGLSECVRVLAHATFTFPAAGVSLPGTVDTVVGAASAATVTLDQVLHQCGDRLTDMLAEGRLYDARDRDASDRSADTVAEVRVHLDAARRDAMTMAAHLRRARAATSHLGIRDDGQGEVDD